VTKSKNQTPKGTCVTTSKNQSPNGSASLSPEAAKFHADVVREYRIDDPAGLTILGLACQALDRIREAQRAMATDGAIVKDKWGFPKAHPATQVEKDARSAFLRAIGSLNLAIAPAAELGAPATKF
jgi:phage terminase small subunit